MADVSKNRPPEQMPGWLSRVDDPYGIVWRASNLLRRLSVRRSAHFLAGLAKNFRHHNPILIVGMPRSGTSFLATLLRESSQLGGLPREGHDVWRMFHHPRLGGWKSDFVGPGEVRRGESRVVNAFLYSYTGGRRLVEKTADNVVRIPYLLDLFPDARFIVMKRSPCDVLNSYIHMWRNPLGRFRSYYVPQDLSIPGYASRRRWCSTLIKGWRDLASAPVPEIAFAQWKTYVEAIELGRGLVPPSQWTEIYFEDLLQYPKAVADDLYRKLGIAHEPRLDAKLADLLQNPSNALSAPRKEKWRSENAAEVGALLARMSPLAATLGYSIDAATGDTVRPESPWADGSGA